MQARIATVLQEGRWGLDGPHWPHLTFYLICQASAKLAETAFKGPFKRSRLLPDFSFYTFVERHLGPFDWQICMPLCQKRWKRSKACPVEVDSIVWIGSRFSPTSYDLSFVFKRSNRVESVWTTYVRLSSLKKRKYLNEYSRFQQKILLTLLEINLCLLSTDLTDHPSSPNPNENADGLWKFTNQPLFCRKKSFTRK